MNRRLSRALASAAAIMLAATAGALPITPATPAFYTSSDSSQPHVSDIAVLTGVIDLFEAYKVDTEDAKEASLPFKDSYSTTLLFDSSDEFYGADVVWDSPNPFISGDAIFLLVKDGNHDPSWYLFDISTWNGTDTINLDDFWPGSGSISNIIIYTSDSTTVPDKGTTAVLIGLGFTALFFAKRGRKSL